ncbi:DUF4377 domain-containing protein [uncultured Bacteroides sp.]|uniref:DUF4377 domain-containing protein n=1 Tax=uncultured Bacteroides sp. TaxID=162156 RepID=UPI00262CAF75|nr:DUF4377 domain-containing protein [uncultured Bacteroides sp.]
MKTFLLCAGCMLMSISFSACLNDDDDVPADKVDSVGLYISGLTCVTGPVWGVDYPMEAMMVKFADRKDSTTLTFDRIDGFTYHRGHEYELRIERTILGMPPADGLGEKYRLLEILSDKEIDATREEVHLSVKSVADVLWGDESHSQGHPVPGMGVQEEGEDTWWVIPYNGIEGFKYEESYSYELIVEKIVPKEIPESTRWSFTTTQYVWKQTLSKSEK